MKKVLLILFLVYSPFLVCSPLIAQDAKVTSLMSKPLSDIPGKELLKARLMVSHYSHILLAMLVR